MWRWYTDARECYAYLVDVVPGQSGNGMFTVEHKPSQWFSRGWTLQELIAPRVLIFFDNTDRP